MKYIIVLFGSLLILASVLGMRMKAAPQRTVQVPDSLSCDWKLPYYVDESARTGFRLTSKDTIDVSATIFCSLFLYIQSTEPSNFYRKPRLILDLVREGESTIDKALVVYDNEPQVAHYYYLGQFGTWKKIGLLKVKLPSRESLVNNSIPKTKKSMAVSGIVSYIYADKEIFLLKQDNHSTVDAVRTLFHMDKDGIF